MKQAVFLLVFLLMPALACADPSVVPSAQGSLFMATAQNNESVGYNCQASYSIAHTDFGVGKVNDFNVSFFVAAKWSGTVISNPTGWTAPIQLSNWHYNCVKAAGAGAPPPSGGGGVRYVTIGSWADTRMPAGTPVVSCDYAQSDKGLVAYRNGVCESVGLRDISGLTPANAAVGGGQCGITTYKFTCGH